VNIIEKLESFQQKLIGMSQFSAACDLQSIIEEYKATAQEPVAYIHWNEYNEYRLEPHHNLDPDKFPLNVDVGLFTHPQSSDETVKDAARYAWLRSDRNISNEGLFVGLAKHGAISRFTDHNADQLIDEAMKADK
jgi:hypothetical protein